MKIRRRLGSVMLVDDIDVSSKVRKFTIDSRDGIETLMIYFDEYDDGVRAGSGVITYVAGHARKWDLYHLSLIGSHDGVRMEATCYPSKTPPETKDIKTKGKILYVNWADGVPFLQIKVLNLIHRATFTIDAEHDICKIDIKKNADGSITGMRGY